MQRYYWDSECVAFCAVHRMIERGDIVFAIGTEIVDGVEKYWADVMR